MSTLREFDPLVISIKDIRDKYRHHNIEVITTLQFFANSHLPPELQAITRPCVKLAFDMVDSMRYNSELIHGLRDLLRAKDCFVRAFLISAIKPDNTENNDIS